MMLADGKGGYSALKGNEHLGTLKSDLGGRDALVAHLNTLESNVNDFGEQLKAEDKSLNNIDTKLDSIKSQFEQFMENPNGATIDSSQIKQQREGGRGH